MKTLSFILLLMFAIQSAGIAFSSSDSLDTFNQQKKHMIDLELGGNSFPYSFGYTYAINARWEVRAGVGYISFPGFGDDRAEGEPSSFFRALNVPLMVNHLRGGKRHKMVLKAGIRFDKLESRFGRFNNPAWNQIHISTTAGAGYRLNGNRNVFGIQITLSYLPFLADYALIPGVGLRYGYRF